MVWYINGDRRNLRLGVSDSGLPICHGDGKHDCRPADLLWDHAAVRTINEMECGWTIARSDDSKSYSYPSDGLQKRINAKPDSSNISIRLWESAKSVCFVVVLPDPIFNRVQRLLEIVLTSESLGFGFNVDFLGCKKEGANVEIPTWPEFIAGKPFFSDEISFSIGVKKEP